MKLGVIYFLFFCYISRVLFEYKKYVLYLATSVKLLVLHGVIEIFGERITLVVAAAGNF